MSVERNIAAKTSDFVKQHYGEGLEPDEWLEYWQCVIAFAAAQLTSGSGNQSQISVALADLVKWYGKRHPETDDLLPPAEQPPEISRAMVALQQEVEG